MSTATAQAAATWVDIRTNRPRGEPLGLFQGYAEAAVEVSSVERALAFYVEGLGLESTERSESHARLRINADQDLLLVSKAEPATRPESGVHLALAYPAADLASTEGRLAARGVAVHRYHEDRPAEREANRYCADPDGNRVQLVSGSARALDHVAIESSDLEWAELFYTHVLGGRIETRVGWRMDDYEHAQAWGRGEDDCAPGTRRWDKLYTHAWEGQDRVARPNAQLFVAFGTGVVLGIYIALEHRQEPRTEEFDGTPRTTFRAAPGRFDEIRTRLDTLRLRHMAVSETSGAAYENANPALVLKDPSGNFLRIVEE